MGDSTGLIRCDNNKWSTQLRMRTDVISAQPGGHIHWSQLAVWWRFSDLNEDASGQRAGGWGEDSLLISIRYVKMTYFNLFKAMSRWITIVSLGISWTRAVFTKWTPYYIRHSKIHIFAPSVFIQILLLNVHIVNTPASAKIITSRGTGDKSLPGWWHRSLMFVCDTMLQWSKITLKLRR